VLGPAERVKARATQATAWRSNVSDGQSSLETLDSVQIMIGKGCSKSLQSRITLGKTRAAK